jgi:alkanesulfonate monooxygenase SsuD/methylene tetrahydromethanopterin reductase-like flavin-dependent oxidoreductase (luciferase family)
MKEARHAIERYKLAFEPSPDLASPYAMIAVTVVCGEDEADATRTAAPLRVAVVKHRTGRIAPILGIEEALAYPFTPDEQAIADDFLTGAIIDGPARTATRLRELARDVGADEVMLSSLVPSLESRRASLERIARECGLEG